MSARSFSVMFALVATAFLALALQTAHARAAALAQTSQPGLLPDAPGKELIERVCNTCHGLDLLVPSERTVSQWRDTLDAMKAAGAKASDEEWKTINEYVMGTLAYLNVNKATANDIRMVFGIDDKIAKAVIAYRDAQGGFKSIEDVQKAPELDAKRVEALKTRLTF